MANQSRLTPFDALQLRVDQRVERRISLDIDKEILDPPWIFTAILGKILVRLGRTISIDHGDHLAECRESEVGDAGDGVYLLHYPFRTWREFEDKIEMARIDMAANSDRPEAFGWQHRRWIRLAGSGKLYEEYLVQFAAAADLEDSLVAGSLCVDDSVCRFHDARPEPTLGQRIRDALRWVGSCFRQDVR